MKNQPSKRASLDWTARTQRSVSVCMNPGWCTGQRLGWRKSDTVVEREAETAGRPGGHPLDRRTQVAPDPAVVTAARGPGGLASRRAGAGVSRPVVPGVVAARVLSGPERSQRIARTSSNSTYAWASKSTKRTSSTGSTVSARTVRTAIRAPSSIGQP